MQTIKNSTRDVGEMRVLIHAGVLLPRTSASNHSLCVKPQLNSRGWRTMKISIKYISDGDGRVGMACARVCCFRYPFSELDAAGSGHCGGMRALPVV
jgi:hypothetical protein